MNAVLTVRFYMAGPSDHNRLRLRKVAAGWREASLPCGRACWTCGCIIQARFLKLPTRCGSARAGMNQLCGG